MKKIINNDAINCSSNNNFPHNTVSCSPDLLHESSFYKVKHILASKSEVNNNNNSNVTKNVNNVLRKLR